MGQWNPWGTKKKRARAARRARFSTTKQQQDKPMRTKLPTKCKYLRHGRLIIIITIDVFKLAPQTKITVDGLFSQTFAYKYTITKQGM